MPTTHIRRKRTGATFGRLAVIICVALAGAWVSVVTDAQAQCTEQGPLQNYTGGGQSVCPCFVVGEQAGAVFNVPVNQYPIEILKVGIGWGSQFGGSPQQLEEAIHIYQGGLPNPGSPIFTLPGPVLTDGAINQFDLQAVPGNKIVPSGPFTVTLEFANPNAGDIFAPSVVHDANGCTVGRNVVFAVPGGWADACALGVTGDWVFFVTYRSLKAVAAVNPSPIVFSGVPAHQTTCDTLYVRNTGCDTLRIAGISGCTGTPFSLDTTGTDHTVAPGDTTPVIVCVTPTTYSSDMCSVSIISNALNGTQTINVSLGVVTAVPANGRTSGTGSVFIFPNPFNPSTTVRFTLPEAMPATAEIYDISGRHVRTLAREERFEQGENVLTWNGRGQDGESVPSGVYLVRVSTQLGHWTVRAVLLK
jgi:hypothetical protein